MTIADRLRTLADELYERGELEKAEVCRNAADEIAYLRSIVGAASLKPSFRHLTDDLPRRSREAD